MAFSVSFAQSEQDQLAAIIAAMPVHEGDPAPDFVLNDLDGQPVRLGDWQGDWVLLDFWGSWCKYCIAAIPAMKEEYAKYHDKGFEIISVDCGDTEEAWKAAVTKYDIPWINVYKPGARSEGVTEEFGVQAYHTFFLINPQGYIYNIYLGENPEMFEQLETIFSAF